MKDIERVGIYGGTFAPPHNGHIRAALTFLEGMSLDRLIIMPACVPPHKALSGGDDPMIRFEMAKAAFDGLSENISVSDYEITKSGVSYTVDTLEHFSKEGRALYFLCGTDMFMSFDTWKSPERIFALCEVVCIPRDDSPLETLCAKSDEYSKRFGAKCHILDTVPFEISSTELRSAVSRNDPVEKYIPESVIRIIERENLYK